MGDELKATSGTGALIGRSGAWSDDKRRVSGGMVR